MFDFAWAQAWDRHGRDYYPKAVSMTPFTPVSGQRLLAADRDPALLRALARAALADTRELGVSSLHILFTRPDEQSALDAAGFVRREDCRFVWHNRGYTQFDDFLANLRAARRKEIRRERRRVRAQGIEVATLVASELSANELRTVYELTAGTFILHGHQPYLDLACVQELAVACNEQMLVNLARRGRDIVGAAILFRDDESLYGRYWGAAADIDCLHFETCYYRGIDYCIEHGLRNFDPGTQGEHKLRRGFAPDVTQSAHWVAATEFRAAIAAFASAERAATREYMSLAAEHLPYRRNT